MSVHNNKGFVLLFAFLMVALPLVSCGATSRSTGTQSLGAQEMRGYDFGIFTNVSITGIDLGSLSEDELALLYAQAMYCQAMTDSDVETMRKLVSEDKVYVHMSGMRQTREEYFADIADGSLRYFSIGIADPVIRVNGDEGSITYTSVLNANAYGSIGTYRMKGTHHYKMRNSNWIVVDK